MSKRTRIRHALAALLELLVEAASTPTATPGWARHYGGPFWLPPDIDPRRPDGGTPTGR